MVTASFKKEHSRPKGADQEIDPSVSDVLVEDPYCHTLVPKKQAVRLQVDNTMVYFCSEKCCTNFVSQHGDKK